MTEQAQGKLKPELGDCVMTASHTRRACDNGGACFCVEHPEEVARINGKRASTAATASRPCSATNPHESHRREVADSPNFRRDLARFDLTELNERSA